MTPISRTHQQQRQPAAEAPCLPDRGELVALCAPACHWTNPTPPGVVHGVEGMATYAGTGVGTIRSVRTAPAIVAEFYAGL